MITPCDCQTPAIRSSRERHPGAVLTHREGWHGVTIGGAFFPLVNLSQPPANTVPVPPTVDPLAALARRAKGAATAEDVALIDRLAARGKV